MRITGWISRRIRRSLLCLAIALPLAGPAYADETAPAENTFQEKLKGAKALKRAGRFQEAIEEAG